MKNIKLLVILTFLVLSLIGCGSTEINNDNQETVKYEHLDKFQKIEIVKADKLEEVTPVIDENTIVEREENEEQTAFKDKYESNIQVDMESIMMTDYNQDWLITPENKNFQDNVYQWITYAIYEYYYTNVPETFKVDLNTDIINSDTNMIFTVRVTGETRQLDILLDMYNEKIIVTEVE